MARVLQGLVGHLGLGTHDKPHAPLHRRWLEDPDAEVLLTVNDYNILRRYGGDESGALTAAAEKNAGVMNAGVFCKVVTLSRFVCCPSR